MMAIELLFGVQTNPGTVITITLSDVNLKTKVQELKLEAAAKCGDLLKDSLELIYCGLVLEDDATVESIGLKNGSMVHAVKKKEAEPSEPTKSVSEDCLLQLASAFMSFHETPVFRIALQRLNKRSEVIDNIISTSPGLHKDFIAIGILHDLSLMSHFTNVDTLRKIAERHPALIEAAQNIVVAVHEEAHNTTCSGFNRAVGSSSHSSGQSFSMDTMSLEEQMTRNISNFFSTHAHISGNNIPHFSNLTPTNSQGIRRSDNPLSSTSAGSTQSASSQTNSTGVVTTQMFMEAMRQVALASNPAPHIPPATVSLSPISPQVTDLQRQLAQMHEMGLQDDVVNVQALQFTNGDVQAAIELVFNDITFSEN